MLKKLLLPVVLALALAGYPAPSHANCTKTGTIIQLFVDDEINVEQHSGRLRTSALSDHVWTFRTVDPNVVTGLIGFMMGQKQVRLIGDAASCPTSGDFRSIGNLGQNGLLTQ